MEHTPEIMKELGELKGTQNAILQLLTKVDQRLDNHSERISGLEKSKAWVIGMAVGIGWLINQLSPTIPTIIPLLHK